METLGYLKVPVGANRICRPLEDNAMELKGAPQTIVSLPNPLPTDLKRRPTLLSSVTSSVASPTLSSIPQLLLSTSLPPLTPQPGASTTFNPRKRMDPDGPTLLSSKDPLSLPTMTNNFKRFVMAVGPVFWLQDRIEEVVLWKKGWLWTTIWMAAYSLLCFYPRLILLLPHLILIGVILATYPYPINPSTDPVHEADVSPSQAPLPAAAEGSASWQANIQGIQNLMGTYSDLHAVVEPYMYHFCLTPAHLSPSKSGPPSLPSRSPYTTHILTLLSLTFPPLLFVVHLPWFPMREICLFVGLAPLTFTHPYVQALIPVLGPAVVSLISRHASQLKTRFMCRYLSTTPTPCVSNELLGEIPRPQPFTMILQRFMDDDRLSDDCWNSEMREVELWENERYGGPMPPISLDLPSGSEAIAAAMLKGWSKQNLRNGERSAWTRARDGSNEPVGGCRVDGSGEVSSSLTFSLALGWAFVESEDWRKDLQCVWSGCGCDPDGWVYTNDAWLGPRSAPYTSSGGSVTRRRRWVRRVWYDPKQLGRT